MSQIVCQLWWIHSLVAKRAELLKIVFSAVVMNREGVVGFSLRPAFRALLSKREAAGDPEHVVEGLLTTIQAPAV